MIFISYDLETMDLVVIPWRDFVCFLSLNVNTIGFVPLLFSILPFWFAPIYLDWLGQRGQKIHCPRDQQSFKSRDRSVHGRHRPNGGFQYATHRSVFRGATARLRRLHQEPRCGRRDHRSSGLRGEGITRRHWRLLSRGEDALWQRSMWARWHLLGRVEQVHLRLQNDRVHWE